MKDWLKNLPSAIGRWLWCICRPCRYVFAEDVKTPDANGFDGHQSLAFFATLLTTQAAALVILAQGNTSELRLKHYLIYFAFAVLPLAGIVAVVLRSATLQGNILTSIYNRATLTFGRWVLLYGLILTIGLPALGWWGWIPGQKTRVDFTDSFIRCLPAQFGETEKLQAHSDPTLDDWTNSISKGLEPPSESRKVLMVIEQDGSFTENFRRFPAWVTFTSNAVAKGGQAYLVRKAGASDITPSILVQRLLPNEESDIQTHVIDIVNPDKGDFLMLFLIVGERSTNQAFPPGTNSSNYGLQLRTR